MAYFLFDEKVYYEAGGKKGSLLKNELGSFLKEDVQEVFAALVNAEPHILALPEDNLEQREKIIHERFKEDWLVQYERIAPNLYQVIGVKKEEIQEIYQLLQGKTVKTLVPYAIALRACLNSRGLLPADQSVIFMDDFKDQILLTILEGAKVFPTRHLVPKSPQGLISEIRRSEQKYSKEYSERYKKEPRFLLVSNSQEIIDEVVSQGLHRQEETQFIDADSPSLEGLKQARFEMHFLLPEEVLKQKKKDEFRKQLKTLVISMVCIGMGVSFLLLAWLGKSLSQEKLQKAQVTREYLLGQLRLEHRKKYKDMLWKSPKRDLAFIYFEFLQNLPAGYKIDHFSLKENGEDRLRLEAVIYGTEDAEFTAFADQGIFKDRVIENIMVKNQPGQKIILEIFSETKNK